MTCFSCSPALRSSRTAHWHFENQGFVSTDEHRQSVPFDYELLAVAHMSNYLVFMFITNRDKDIQSRINFAGSTFARLQSCMKYGYVPMAGLTRQWYDRFCSTIAKRGQCEWPKKASKRYLITAARPKKGSFVRPRCETSWDWANQGSFCPHELEDNLGRRPRKVWNLFLGHECLVSHVDERTTDWVSSGLDRLVIPDQPTLGECRLKYK